MKAGGRHYPGQLPTAGAQGTAADQGGGRTRRPDWRPWGNGRPVLGGCRQFGGDCRGRSLSAQYRPPEYRFYCRAGHGIREQVQVQRVQQSLEQLSLTYNAEWVVRSDWSNESGYNAMKKLIGCPDITAVIASNDETAIGVLRAVQENGNRRTPEAGQKKIIADVLTEKVEEGMLDEKKRLVSSPTGFCVKKSYRSLRAGAGWNDHLPVVLDCIMCEKCFTYSDRNSITTCRHSGPAPWVNGGFQCIWEVSI